MSNFDPQKMFGETLDAAELEFATLQASFDRLRRLKKMMADEFEKLQARAETFGVFTEAEAAKMLKLDNPNAGDAEQAEKALATLRRRHHFPHVVFNRTTICYTSAQIAEICEMLSVNTKVRKAALAKAA